MKTIDEVIKAVQHCGLVSGFDDYYEYDGGCPYEDCSVCEKKRQLGKDITHYLKEYRRVQKRMESIALGSIEETLAKMDNPPITWDELKGMGGKPVWIEYADDEEQTGWALIAKNPERPMFGNPKLFTLAREDGKFYLTISGYGKRWQAYRKERK